MNKALYTGIAVITIAVVVLAIRIPSLSGAIESQGKQFRSTLAALQDSLKSLRSRIDSLKLHTSGLGEYMSAIQLHTAKLWFAGQASNWDLALYELNELGEAIEGAEALHAVRDSVNVSAVLQSLSNTQLEMLKRSIQRRQMKSFTNAYNQTLETCNACHRSARYEFIHIIVPTSPPVTNQRWQSK